jgi:outer membrane protein OmpA-like peptidoglycan-associated protein/opacity protein-like surface antigen
VKFVARLIVTMAVALVVVPASYADDTTKSKADAKKDESAPSVTAPTVAAKAESDTPETLPVGSLTSGQPAGEMRHSGGSENYTPKVEWFFGYSFWRAVPASNSNRMGYLHGGSTSIAYNLNRYVGLVADFAGFDNSRLTLFNPSGNTTVDSNGSAYTYLFGPRFSYRRHERFTPFFEVLFGGVHASSVKIDGCAGDPSCTPLGSDNAFAAILGAGLDIKVSHHVALRLLEGDFLLTHFKDPFSTDGEGRGWQKNVRVSAGIVFRLGGNPPPPPNRSPVASCSIDKTVVYAGSGDFAVVRAHASDPDNDPLTYSWAASGGTVEGTGPDARWSSAGATPGTYAVKVRVDDGRGGTAGCSADIRVERQPNRPPTISCSADRRAVTVGDSVQITATASDPDNDPLTFLWTASVGRIEGSGSFVKFQTADLPPGPYTITGQVDDGRTGTASCTVNIDVRAAQLPPEVKELEARLSLHSIYFPTARPTVANPTGGLVESQQTVLVSLARDFNRYLTFKPQAHLILDGHADRRGSIEYNKGLTERRVERTKSFLVEHGVPAENIETQALGKQENLNAEQVKQLVDQNPGLSGEERERIESNLQVIVLANNRRVDVSLNTTGQQSMRQYPFNAKDSLTLLSTRGGESEKRTRPPAKNKATQP